MIPTGPGSARRPHPDSPVEADPNEESRRVRPRTQEAGAGDTLSGLSPRGAPPGGSPPESPRRSLVSVQQLQQWHGSTGPRSPLQAVAGAPASLIAPAQASTSSSRPAGAAQPAPFDAMQAVPLAGRNTLVAYAVEQHLAEAGTRASWLRAARSSLIQFGSALRWQQPPVPLNEFLDRLCSPEPAVREAATALKDRLTSEPTFTPSLNRGLKLALDALPDIPPERRMLTLQQALHSMMKAPALKTLLPAADIALLQQVQNFERNLTPVAAGQRQVLLIRLGIALRAEGHGGLAGWLEMHGQAEGSRQANELLERFKNGPELALSDVNKQRLGKAVAGLQASAVGDGGGSSGASLAPQFPDDFPLAEANLTNACLQAGLDKGLSRATVYRYGRELIGLSEWLRKPADADRPAQPTGLRAVLDLPEAARRDLVAAFVATKPNASESINSAVRLLLAPPVPVPEPGTAGTPPPALPSAAVPFAAEAGEAAAGPSAAAASPSTSAWSLASVYERLGGAEGIQAWMQEVDEVMSSYQPGVSTPAGTSQAFDLDAHYRQLSADDSTGVLLENLGGAMARAHPEAEAATHASAALEAVAGERVPSAGPPNPAAPDAAPAVVHAMSAEAAVQWFNSRLQDIQMTSSVQPKLPREELLLLADHLAEGPGESALHGLNGFLQRYESSDPALRDPARAELGQYLDHQLHRARSAGRPASLVRGLDLLASVPPAQRVWTDPAARISLDSVSLAHLRRLLPPQDRALLERVKPSLRAPLAQFARAMLSEGQGGLAHWLLMFREGRGQQARQLMRDFGAAVRGRLSLAGDRLLAASGARAVAPDLPGPSASVRSPGSGGTLPGLSPRGALPGAPRRPSVPGEQLQQWRNLTGPRSARQATSSAWASLTVPAQASTSSPRPSGAVAARRFDAMQAVPPKGRNTLVVYAAEQLLREDGVQKGRLADVRSALNRFGDTLLQRQPAVTLEQFVDRLSGPAALKAALANEPGLSKAALYHLEVAFEALSKTPSERRMLTLHQALHSSMQARMLKTLLPEADIDLLRQLQDFDRNLSPMQANSNQVMLISLGIALMAEGHGGLAGWLEMHNQPEGSRLANELLERVKNGPELALSDVKKGKLGKAAARLQASAVGEGGGSSGASLAPRFPDDFPPAEASLTNACLQAGLEKGLSRATLFKYGRDLIGLSEWLRNSADAGMQAQPTGLRAVLDLPEAARRDLVAAFVAARPTYSHTINRAVGLLRELSVPVPGPSAAASPSTSAWSLGSAYERVGGAAGIQAWMREVDADAISNYQPGISAPAGPSLTGDPLVAADTRSTSAQPSSSSAPPQDDPLQGFAESLERSLASPSPQPEIRQHDTVPAAAASPGPGAMEEDILADPGTPTAGDFAFLTDPFGPGHGDDPVQDPWSDLALSDDEHDHPATPPDSGR